MARFLITILLFLSSYLFSAIQTDTLRTSLFGCIHVYRTSPQPKQIVLLISGDGGWNMGVVDMAQELTKLDALVIGIDINAYLRNTAKIQEPCFYPAADFEMLSKFIQKTFQYSTYTAPVLVGYSSGATLVYAVLVQAPATTFRGAISLGFCPDLPFIKPYCKGSGLTWHKSTNAKDILFEPAKTLETPWFALQGVVDQVCPAPETEKFVKQVANGHLVSLTKVGHGFSVQKNWLPAFRQAFQEITNCSDATSLALPIPSVKDLPLIEMPAKSGKSDVMAVQITGDGGWGVTDKGIAQALTDRGISVIGFNSLQYFWNKKTPDQSSLDLARVLDVYQNRWQTKKILLIGYSLGGDVLPFMVHRLPSALKERIALIVLMGPSADVKFEFHLTDWLGKTSHGTVYKVVPEIEKLAGLKILCFCGSDDPDAICNQLPAGLVKTLPLSGGHRIGSHFDPIVKTILEEMTILQ